MTPTPFFRIGLSVLALLPLLTGCPAPQNPNSVNVQALNLTLARGSAVLEFQLPPGTEFSTAGGASRVVDPNTATVKLTVNGLDGGSVATSSGTGTNGIWTGTFATIPVGTYAPGKFVVSLLAADETMLALGVNAVSVTIAAESTPMVSITPKPAEALVTDVVLDQKIDTTIPSGSTRYYRIRNYAAYVALCPSFYHPRGGATMIFLDQEGTLLHDGQGQPGVRTITGPQQDQDRSWWSFGITGDLYVGLVSQSYEQTPFSAEAFINGPDRGLLATFNGYDVNQYPQDYGRWPIVDGSTVDIVIPQFQNRTYEFRFRNTSSASPKVTFSRRSPASITTTDPRISIDSQDDFGTSLSGGNEFGLRLRINTGDKDGVPDGTTGSALVQVPNDTSAGGILQFMVRYTVGAGTPSFNLRYNNQPVRNNSTIDLGDLGFGNTWYPEFTVDNNTKGRLDLASAVITGASALKLNNLPGPYATSAYTFWPWNRWDQTFRLDLNATTSADEGTTGSSTVTMTTNDPLRPTFTFSVTYRVALPPVKCDVVNDNENPQSKVAVRWKEPSKWLPSGTAKAYRVYRSAGRHGPYAAVATVTSTGATDYSYLDTGLATGVLYFYKIEALLDTATHPVGHTARTLHPNRITTFDPALADAYKRVGTDWMSFWNPYSLAVGATARPTIFPRGNEDDFTFTPVPGSTYTITLSSLSLTEGLTFSLATGVGDSPQNQGNWPYVDSRESPSKSITWTFPNDYPPTARPVIIVSPFDQTSGQYSLSVHELPQSAHLLGHWRLNGDGKNTVAGGLGGKLANANPVADRNAVADGALFLSGATSSVEFPLGSLPPQILGANPKFVGLWVRPDSRPIDRDNTLVFMGPPSSDQDGEQVSYRFVINSAGNLGINESWSVSFSDVNVAVGEWTYVFSGFDGKDWYVGKVNTDGTVTRQSLNQPASNLRQGILTIGRDAINNWYGNGSFDGLSLFDCRPTDDQIATLANLPDGSGFVQVTVQ